MQPSDLLSARFRLTPLQGSALKRLGLLTIEDLLRHFPSRYDRAGERAQTRELVKGSKVTLFGTLSKLKAKKLWKSRRNITEGYFEDASGKVKVMWFNQPYMASYIPEGSMVRLSGIVGGSAGKPYIANPEAEVLPPGFIVEGIFETKGEDRKKTDRQFFPIYPESRGITSLWFFHKIKELLEAGMHKTILDPIPDAIRAQYNLPDLASALVWIHTPEKESHAEVARKRFSFEEIFALQIARARERNANEGLASFSIPHPQTRADSFIGSLGIRPTRAQRRAIDEILVDFEKPHPMARLLEGDVGAGKTLVAAATAYAVVTSRPPNRLSGTLQVAYMAPTEILASQHFQSFIEYFRELPINIGLITGSGCKKFPSKTSKEGSTDISRSQLLKWVANGEIAMVVGTHALIQKSVKFQHLAYAIIDEQHRFGTKQRRELAHKGDPSKASGQAPAPHFLSMTATPIPRTLALTIYGDLDISVLDELPPGRAKITTRIIEPEDRERAYGVIRAELAKGRQAYVVCPRIEEADPAKLNALQAKSAKAEAKRLASEIFLEYEVGLLHGAMKQAEKDAVMLRFSRGEVHVLVATSVIEVGINVLNATVIMIEGAERFGLAQLHQLRGRVMRSSHPPTCFLLPESRSEASKKRLRALETSDDGFMLAEADLETRGAGDLYGRQQWGVSDLGMEALKNPRLIKAARDEAQSLIALDPDLKAFPALRNRIREAERVHAE
ncbi:ATP-dependent DNA helicase RecG [Candidatus Kaiserbacteria bacterium]|nr:ATP-dependent DNA helicase RecG [Candidatus Kaiserbacteria bacterium]